MTNPIQNFFFPVPDDRKRRKTVMGNAETGKKNPPNPQFSPKCTKAGVEFWGWRDNVCFHIASRKHICARRFVSFWEHKLEMVLGFLLPEGANVNIYVWGGAVGVISAIGLTAIGLDKIINRTREGDITVPTDPRYAAKSQFDRMNDNDPAS
eukprot:g49399.t1